VTERYDVVIVGSGPGGGTVAAHAAEAGLRVLLVERGAAIAPVGALQDHLHNTMSWRYRNMCHAPDSDPRTVESAGVVQVVEPPDSRRLDSAYALGGGSLTWGMQAWRFDPDDFRMASKYGIPAGSSLADWPLTYEDLKPFYAQAERELGVAGPVGGGPGVLGDTAYPMAPFTPSAVDAWLAAGARRCGWATQPVPLAINTVPFYGRPACIRCRQCIGFACPVDAKNGSHNTMVPRAVETGLCQLALQTRVTEVTTDGRGVVDGVELIEPKARGGLRRRRVRAQAVVLAAGAIETARLLLLSRSRQHPDGLGNAFGHVGRHLQTHTYPVAMGVLPPDVAPVLSGPGVGTATLALTHDNPGVIGGALLANDFVKTPVAFWESALPPDVPRWGKANKDAMRRLFGRVVDIRGPVQQIPSPDCRVTLQPGVRDALGVPAVRLSGALHPETRRTARFIEAQAVRWLTESGAEPVWVGQQSDASYHQAGTARMSRAPEDGVTDPSGRVHGHDNLFVADASVHVTNGAFNPALTIFALSIRGSQSIIETITAGRGQ
jgi:choline dehydrogenase-like flavoprotein